MPVPMKHFRRSSGRSQTGKRAALCSGSHRGLQDCFTAWHTTGSGKRPISVWGIPVPAADSVQGSPVHAIQIQDGKPVWVKKQCTMCLGCLHRCPKFSIRYGKSDRHGQYRHP